MRPNDEAYICREPDQSTDASAGDRVLEGPADQSAKRRRDSSEANHQIEARTHQFLGPRVSCGAGSHATELTSSLFSMRPRIVNADRLSAPKACSSYSELFDGWS